MEDGLLPNPRIKEALKNLVVLWLHTDHGARGTEYRRLERELVGFETSPYWVIVDPESSKTLRVQEYTEDVETFLRFLRGN